MKRWAIFGCPFGTAGHGSGDYQGSSIQVADYSINSLNQITSRDVPGVIDVLGVATATNTATVNGNSAYRKGEYFHYPLSVDNSSDPVWQGITNALTGTAVSTNGHVLLPPETQSFSYDADGNLTNDLVWEYVWAAENRLSEMISLTTVPTEAQQKLVFEYDFQGRRIHKQVYTNRTGTGTAVVSSKFLYDGWNVVRESGP